MRQPTARLDAARAAGVTDAGIAETIRHVALHVLTNHFTKAADVPVDFPPSRLRPIGDTVTHPAWPSGLPVTQVRVARPTDRLAEVVRFYADDLGLPVLDRFTGHAGYDGVMVGLPGTAHHLEFTSHVDGSPGPAPTPENLLVLYLGDRAALDAVVARLTTHHPAVTLDNPYWAQQGAVAVADPDGWRVVLVPASAGLYTADAGADVRVETFTGPRDELRPLFELAEDSAAELDSYLHAGDVLVAVVDGTVVGHLQLVDAGPGQAEIKNMAVREELRGRGVGRLLVRAALGRAAARGVTGMSVATGAADVGNLRFYQRQGFRMRAVERDAFTTATGYPPGLEIDGIPLRDRVWLDRPVAPDSAEPESDECPAGWAGHGEA
jgi:GNAT superfamily N-acetyltransferase